LRDHAPQRVQVRASRQGAAEQLLWRLRSAGVKSWFIAPDPAA